MKKFLCDQMCVDLGRWLRAAGYDTEIITTSLPDKQVFEKAVREERFLITKDKLFDEIDPEKKTVIYLQGETLDEWAEQLKVEESIDWLTKPFSRCLQCNSPLEKIALTDVPEEAPKDVKEFWSCPTCEQIFWLGSHTEHMKEQLKTWQGD